MNKKKLFNKLCKEIRDAAIRGENSIKFEAENQFFIAYGLRETIVSDRFRELGFSTGTQYEANGTRSFTISWGDWTNETSNQMMSNYDRYYKCAPPLLGDNKNIFVEALSYLKFAKQAELSKKINRIFNEILSNPDKVSYKTSLLLKDWYPNFHEEILEMAKDKKIEVASTGTYDVRSYVFSRVIDPDSPEILDAASCREKALKNHTEIFANIVETIQGQILQVAKKGETSHYFSTNEGNSCAEEAIIELRNRNIRISLNEQLSRNNIRRWKVTWDTELLKNYTNNDLVYWHNEIKEGRKNQYSSEAFLWEVLYQTSLAHRSAIYKILNSSIKTAVKRGNFSTKVEICKDLPLEIIDFFVYDFIKKGGYTSNSLLTTKQNTRKLEIFW